MSAMGFCPASVILLFLLILANCTPADVPQGAPDLPPENRYLWAQRYGSIGDDRGQALAVAPGGDLVVSGFVNGRIDFGGGPLPGTGKETAFVARYTRDGKYVWSRSLDGPGYAEALAVAVDQGGDVLVCGVFSGSVDLGTGRLLSAGLGDAFIARYAAADGRPLWAARYGGPGDDRALKIAVDGKGDVLVTGLFADTADLGTGPLVSQGTSTAFLARYAGPDGTPRWAHGFPGTGRDSGISVVADRDGNVLVTGLFTDTIDLGKGILTTAGGGDVFLGRFAADGSPLWAMRFGGAGSDVVTAMTLDGGGEVVLGGIFNGTTDLGQGPVPSAGNFDIFLVRRAVADGRLLWARHLGGPGEDVASAVAMAGADGIAVAGSFEGTADLGKGPLQSAGGVDIFAGSYALGDGTARWTQRFGGDSGDYALGIGVHDDGSLTVTGAFAGVADLGGGPLQSAGRTDAFVLHLAP